MADRQLVFRRKGVINPAPAERVCSQLKERNELDRGERSTNASRDPDDAYPDCPTDEDLPNATHG